MIEELGNLPAGVTGFTLGGRVRAEDYRDVILPAIERAAATGEIRFVIVIESFDGMTGGAVWQDLKVGFEHLTAWKRIAVVTEISWMTHLTDLFGWMTPGSTKTFPLSEREAAIAWAAAQDPPAP
jgi:SpoIIAA-like